MAQNHLVLLSPLGFELKPHGSLHFIDQQTHPWLDLLIQPSVFCSVNHGKCPWGISLLKNSPLNFLFLLALLLFLSACVNSVSSLTSPLPLNISSGASIAASETATGAIYHRTIYYEQIYLSNDEFMQVWKVD